MYTLCFLENVYCQIKTPKHLQSAGTQNNPFFRKLLSSNFFHIKTLQMKHIDESILCLLFSQIRSNIVRVFCLLLYTQKDTQRDTQRGAWFWVNQCKLNIIKKVKPYRCQKYEELVIKTSEFRFHTSYNLCGCWMHNNGEKCWSQACL